ncbi:tRNA dimethylallyltransferase-like isoform X2 [Anopheles albimanus]|uniref:tRNA dimethylallyltransferase-like isoform X2 n=1 Tax=Anopheles albimanus TaxID=7167 RepID=UPI001640FF18|nr:tRNA dimethylallyltransferase-like isoform X2 [Anopheles albimanus]
MLSTAAWPVAGFGKVSRFTVRFRCVRGVFAGVTGSDCGGSKSAKMEPTKTKPAPPPPIVVILGSTGTGKTKLSLELAIRYGGEIVSADSMQIDSLLAAGRMPIVVGGTNYYIESLLWKVLIGDGVQREHIRRRNADSDVDTDADSDVEADAESTKRPKSGAGSGSAVAAGQERIQNPTPKPAPAPEQQVSDLLERCRAGTVSVDQLESYDSPLLHKVLAVVDQPSANRLHPNNKRKIIRALEVYLISGGTQTMNQALNAQRAAPGASSLGGPLRYGNVVILWLRCEQDALNKRLDARVDSMVAQGLLPEIRAFYEQHVKPYKHQDYHQGILQSIGFKEFVKYLERYDTEHDQLLLQYLTAPPDGNEQPDGLAALGVCLDYLKLVTRRYARRQQHWIKNRFLGTLDRDVPPIYALDTTDATGWNVQVTNRAVAIIDAVLGGRMPPYEPVTRSANPASANLSKEGFFECAVCQRVIIGEYQWQLHLRSNKHRKVAKRNAAATAGSVEKKQSTIAPDAAPDT